MMKNNLSNIELNPLPSSAIATVDLSAYQFNLNKLKQLVPNSQQLAIVKANAYGHGALMMAQNADMADGFGVARIEEAIALRGSGITKPILLLEGIFDPQHVQYLIKFQLQTVVHCLSQLEALEAYSFESTKSKPEHKIKTWIKVDSGMHRLGVMPEQVDEYTRRLQACQCVDNALGYVSHFACADDLDSHKTQQQIECFNVAIPNNSLRSIAASAGILEWPQSHFEWVRPGIISYGISPFADKTAAQLGFKPVMTLSSHLIAVRDLNANEPVGYGASWQSAVPTRIGVVALGYGDGYPRTAPSGTPVLINGRKVPIVGRVSMDMITVDLGENATDQVNDKVIFWGEDLPVEEIAEHVGTIGYELVTRLTSRIEIKYIKN